MADRNVLVPALSTGRVQLRRRLSAQLLLGGRAPCAFLLPQRDLALAFVSSLLELPLQSPHLQRREACDHQTGRGQQPIGSRMHGLA